MVIGHAQEDYLEAIYILHRKYGEVRCVDVAEFVKRSKATVSVAMKELNKKGYVYRDGGANLCLTDKGRMLADRVYERHCFFKRFLTEAGVSEEIAEKDACLMEHIISEESYQRLQVFLVEQVEERKLV